MYSLSLSGMRGLIEEWTGMGDNEDAYAPAVLWMHRRITNDYETSKKATMLFWTDNMLDEHRSGTESGYFVLYHNMKY